MKLVESVGFPKWVLISLVPALAGCVSAPPAASPYLTITSVPSGATVKFPDGTTCTTPCPAIINEPMNATVAKVGYLAQTIHVMPEIRGEETVFLELAAPTQDVEASQLPDL